MISRSQMLALLGAAVASPLAACSTGDVIRVGSKNFTEAFVIAEIYAQALEAKGLRVERKFNLGSVQIALAALQRGDIDVYPEYTGTALIDVLHMKPLSNANAIYHAVQKSYARLYGLTWLAPSPMNDSQALATTQAISKQFRFTTLSQLAQLAPQLRLATIPEFLGRPDGLPGLQKAYGGFQFKEVRTYDIGLKYEALLREKADVATAFTTDGEIGANNLLILTDDKHFWPYYNVAPVVRNATLRTFPRLATILNAVSPFITDIETRQMNYAVEHDKADPADVARQFLSRHAI